MKHLSLFILCLGFSVPAFSQSADPSQAAPDNAGKAANPSGGPATIVECDSDYNEMVKLCTHGDEGLQYVGQVAGQSFMKRANQAQGAKEAADLAMESNKAGADYSLAMLNVCGQAYNLCMQTCVSASEHHFNMMNQYMQSNPAQAKAEKKNLSQAKTKITQCKAKAKKSIGEHAAQSVASTDAMTKAHETAQSIHGDNYSRGGPLASKTEGFLKNNKMGLLLGGAAALGAYMMGNSSGKNKESEKNKGKNDVLQKQLALSNCLLEGHTNCASRVGVDCSSPHYRNHEACQDQSNAENSDNKDNNNNDNSNDANCTDPSKLSHSHCIDHYVSACALDMKLSGCDTFNTAYCTNNEKGSNKPKGDDTAYCTLVSSYAFCKGGAKKGAPSCVWVSSRATSCRSNPSSYECLPHYTSADYAAACAAQQGDPLCGSSLGSVIGDDSQLKTASYNSNSYYATQSARSPASAQSLWSRSSSAFDRACQTGTLYGCQ